MLTSVAFISIFQLLSIPLYLYAKYKSRKTLTFCINRARVNLAARLTLENCVRIINTLLHCAFVNVICNLVSIAILYVFVIFQHSEFVQNHHADMETLLIQGQFLINQLACPMIILLEIQVLKEKFYRLIPWKNNVVVPATVFTVLQDVKMKHQEADVRLNHLENAWDKAFNVAH